MFLGSFAVSIVLLRSVLADESLDASVRLTALKVLGTTQSPVRNEIINDFRESNAPPALKRQSLEFLDSTESAHELLIKLSGTSELGGEATRLLIERFSKTTPQDVLRATLPVADPKATAIDSIIGTLLSSQRLNEKEKSTRTVLKRVPAQDRMEVLTEVREVTRSMESKALIDKIAEEVKP